MQFLDRYLDELWLLMLDTGIWLIAGLAFAGVVHAIIPSGWLARQLGGRGAGSIFKAAALGLPMPLCSCAVIPVAAGLRRGGAAKGASAAFAISTPQTGEESIPLTWALFGPVFALTRPVVAVATAAAAGLLIDRFAEDREPADDGGRGDCCHANAHEPDASVQTCCHAEGESAAREGEKPGAGQNGDARRGSVGERAWNALRYGFGTMLTDLAPWLAAGLLLSALVAALVPENWLTENVGTGILPMLAMLLVGLPIYVCATSSTPLAYTLVVAGLSPGAALVLLLAGPASNAATMAWVLKDLGARALAIYLATIAVCAVAAGLAFDALLAGFVAVAETAEAHGHGAANPVLIAGAAVFSAMLVAALAWRGVGLLRGRSREGEPSTA